MKIHSIKHIINKKILYAIFIIIILCVFSVNQVCFSQGIGDIIGETEIKMYLGESRVFSAYKPTRIVVGNPQVADVINPTEDSVTLITKSAGNTSFAFWDIFGEHSYKVKVLSEDMLEVGKRINELLVELHLPGVYTKVNEEEGKILLLGEVYNQQDKDQINLVLGMLKSKTIDLIKIKEESGIVEIGVKVLELNKDASRTLGLTWPGSIALTETNSPSLLSSTTSQVGTTSSTATTTGGGTTWENLFKVVNISRDAFTLSLDALVQEGKARILSQPKLACLSGKEAELLVGGEKPIFTTAVASTIGTTSTNVKYKEYGIKLNIKPTINKENRIHVALNVEVSEVGTAETIGSTSAPTAKAYPLTTRNVSTELYLNDSQTLAIGGLIKQKTEEDIRKTAGLGDIPILGLLFRKKTVQEGGGQGERGDMELFITLTPTIVAGSRMPINVASEKVTAAASQAPHAVLEKGSSFLEYQDMPANLRDYISKVFTKIIDAVYYPEDAKKYGYEGTVHLGLFLMSSGRIETLSIIQSSGYRMLDEAALDVVNKQAPFSPFPPQVSLKELKVEVPITYQKDNK